MKKIFDKGVCHIIFNCFGLYIITSDIDSELFFLSTDGVTKKIEVYGKVTYVYQDGKNGIFVPSMYYRAVGYKKGLIQKYRTKMDLLEGNQMAACSNDSIYYYSSPVSSNAKLWKLNLESGVNEEIELHIPKRKKRKIRYSYISVDRDELIIIYYYFGEQEICFDDMFMRVYKIVDNRYELINERLIEKGVRAIYNECYDKHNGNVLLFDKVICENGRVKVKGEYLATLDNKKQLKKIFSIPYDIDNGLVSYAISFDKKKVALMWKHKVMLCDLDTGKTICDLTTMLKENIKERFFCVRFNQDKLLIASDCGLFELETGEYLGN